MKIQVLIVEDESIIADEIKDCLEENDFTVTDIVSTSETAIRSIEQQTPDVILMDISIKGKLNGIELAREILSKRKIPLIFLTSHTDKQIVRDAQSVHPDAFLVKPFNETELPVAIELAFTQHNQQLLKELSTRVILNDAVFIKNNKKYQKVNVSDILYIQADGAYSRIHTSMGEFVMSFNLSQFHSDFNNRFFIRIHRSYIINLKSVSGFDNDNVYIDKISIPISKQYMNDFMHAIKKI